MLLLGLLVMAGCVALAADAVAQNTGPVQATVFGQPVPHLSAGAVFVAGAVLGVLFVVGLALARRGVRSAAARRRERRAAARLREDNARLEAELARERDATSGPAYPAEPGRARRPVGRHRG